MLLSLASSDSQARGMGGLSPPLPVVKPSSQELTSVLLPKPAGAQTRVKGSAMAAVEQCAQAWAMQEVHVQR